jgi:integrase
LGSRLAFTTRYGTPIEPRNFNRDWDARVRRYGLRRITPHGARRTCAGIRGWAHGVRTAAPADGRQQAERERSRCTALARHRASEKIIQQSFRVRACLVAADA